MSEEKQEPQLLVDPDTPVFDIIEEETEEITDETTEEVEEKEESEESEETEETETPEDSEETEEEEEPDEGIANLFNFMKDQGFVEVEEDFEFSGKPSDLGSLIESSYEKQVEKARDEVMSTIPSDEGKALFEYFQNGGTDISSFVSTYGPQDFEGLDPQDEDDAKKLITMRYQSETELSKEDIQDIVDNMGDKIYDKAEKIKGSLMESKKEQQTNFIEQQKEIKKAALQYEKDLRGTISNMKLPEDKRNWVLSNFNEVSTNEGKMLHYDYLLTQIMRNPGHMVQLLLHLQNYDPKEGFKYSTEQKQKTSKKANELKNYFKGSDNSGQSKMKGHQETKQKTAGGMPQPLF